MPRLTKLEQGKRVISDLLSRYSESAYRYLDTSYEPIKGQGELLYFDRSKLRDYVVFSFNEQVYIVDTAFPCFTCVNRSAEVWNNVLKAVKSGDLKRLWFDRHPYASAVEWQDDRRITADILWFGEFSDHY